MSDNNPTQTTQVLSHPAEGTPMQGSPEQGFVNQLAQQRPSSTPAAPTTTTQASPASAPASGSPAKESVKIMLGNRTFNSTEELATYAQALEEEKRQNEQVRNIVNPQPQAKDIFDEAEEMIYTNPKQALKNVADRAAQDAETRIMNRIKGNEVEKEFYRKFPDLVGQEDIVRLYFGQKQTELAKMPEDQALSTLANAVRAKLSSIRGQSVGAETLPNTRATTAPASGGAPAVAVQAESRPKTMFEQMQQMRHSRSQGTGQSKR